MSNPAVPERVRRAPNVESGLDDGLVFPVLLIVASIAETDPERTRSALGWTGFTLARVRFGFFLMDPMEGCSPSSVG